MGADKDVFIDCYPAVLKNYQLALTCAVIWLYLKRVRMSIPAIFF